jgi:excinuclease ABC subunit A
LDDLGAEGGDAGGQVVAVGTPEEIAANPKSYTGHYLKQVFDGRRGAKPKRTVAGRGVVSVLL